MMKKTYQIPETYIFEKMVVASLLAASLVEDDSTRKAEGDPTGNGLPSGIVETEDIPDPFGGKGQDGNTTRANQWTGDW